MENEVKTSGVHASGTRAFALLVVVLAASLVMGGCILPKKHPKEKEPARKEKRK